MDEYEKKRVLLVEDNARLRDTVREVLRWRGYQADEAGDGAKALAVAAAAQPDVIVTDLSMPVMDRAAFIQRCRRQPGLNQVPIIVMSAAERDSLDSLSAAHVSAYLVKPFDLVDLTTAIDVGRATERWPVLGASASGFASPGSSRTLASGTQVVDCASTAGLRFGASRGHGRVIRR